MTKIQQNNFTNFLLYKSWNWEIKVDVFLKDENIWLSQKKISELFFVDRSVITKHIKNIFETWELEENSNVQKMHFAHSDKPIKYYNLDTIIAVWYRVNSKRATEFRIWANKILKEYIIKWYSMDVEKLKNPNNPFWKDYFDEQLEIIRDIRSSERRLYQKITDIYSQCSIDYDKNSEITKKFFSTVQNKLHWAITKQTAAEIVISRSDHKKEKMWLTTWKNSPNWKIRKNDVSIAKNYLNEKELKPLNRIVSMYLDYAEDHAEKYKAMTMHDWAEKLDKFLNFNEKDILTNSWKITAKLAKEFAENEFEKFSIIQDKNYISDFDRETERFLKSNK